MDQHLFDIQSKLRADAANRALEEAFKQGLLQGSIYVSALLLEVQRLERELAAHNAETPEDTDKAMRALADGPKLPYTKTFTQKHLQELPQLRLAIAGDPQTATIALRVEEAPQRPLTAPGGGLILPPTVMKEAQERFAAGERAPAEPEGGNGVS